MQAPVAVLSFVMALSFTTAIMRQASAESQAATSQLSPSTQEHNSRNRAKGAATGTEVGGRASHHNLRQGRRHHGDSWWNVIG
jgi:hypothetical protein